MRKITKYGLHHLLRSEGKRNQMYKDSAGYPTIGVGHLLTRSELSSGKIYLGNQVIRWKNGLTDVQVMDLLAKDVGRFEIAVDTSVEVDLTAHQFDALVSLAFNIGSGAFRRSTLLKRVNSSRFKEVPEQFRRWNRAGGKVSRGLANRREREIALWLKKGEADAPITTTPVEPLPVKVGFFQKIINAILKMVGK